MKPGLKRIEVTLHQLSDQSSYKRSTASGKRTAAFQVLAETTLNRSASPKVQPFSTQQSPVKTPTLPKIKAPSFSSHRHGANPALAMSLLKEIEELVSNWQVELNQILLQIQELYLEGPIVDGWLESHAREPEPGVTNIRHTEVDRLMDYVEEICSLQPDKVSCQSPRTGYHLCGLNPDGKAWSRPCPPEQVPSVGVAIARYQKLRQLLARKQYLETHLSQLAETLVVLHSHLQGTDQQAPIQPS
jgi:hypothetical protein